MHTHTHTIEWWWALIREHVPVLVSFLGVKHVVLLHTLHELLSQSEVLWEREGDKNSVVSVRQFMNCSADHRMKFNCSHSLHEVWEEPC